MESPVSTRASDSGTTPASHRPVGARRVPRQARARHLVESVLEAARELVTTGGFERLSTRALARRAGASVGSVYQYFADREAVLEALFERLVTEVERDVDAQIDEAMASSPSDAIATVLHRYVSFIRRHRRVLLSVVDHALRSEHIERIGAFEVRAADRLRHRMEREGHPVSNTQALAAVQVVSTLGARVAIESESGVDARAAEHQVLDAALAVLGLPPRSPTPSTSTVAR